VDPVGRVPSSLTRWLKRATTVGVLAIFLGLSFTLSARSVPHSGLSVPELRWLPDSAEALARCPRGGRTLRRTLTARVWKARTGYYGCAFRAGRIYRLGGYSTLGGDNLDAARQLALAGPVVALVSEGFEIRVRSLRSGRVLHHVSNTIASDQINESQSPVDKLVVKSNGSVAWIASGRDGEGDPNPPPRDPTEVHVLGSDNHHQIVARDPKISVYSLRLLPGGGGVSWQSDGQTHTAPLR